jgi:type IV secretory pathway TraG/TraD family ATPase VirD4
MPATWHSLTHGTNGLVLAYGLTFFALVITLVQQRAGARAILLSPLLTLPCAAVGALAVVVAVSLTGSHATPRISWMSPALSIAILLFAGFAGGMIFARRPKSTDTHKRGTVVGTAKRREPTRVGAVTLAGVEIPELDETKHFKLLGTTGSGKSTAIREVLSGALQRGDRAIIADPDGSYLKHFYTHTRGDVILNPFEERSYRWDLFGEIEKPYDVEQVARSLISEGADDASREWRAYARTFLAAVLEYCKLEDRHDLAEVWRLISVADAEELKDILAGSAAQPFLADGASKMFHSIRGTASPALAALKYVKKASAPPLSVRQWVREGRGVLFLPYTAGQIAALRDLIATWLRLAIFETMSGGEGDRRLWFIIDELDALGQIDGLKDALARLRKFGGRCVLGFQSIAQVRGTYGDTEAQTIVENCGNTLILRCSASERGGTAEFASRLIGKREIIRRQVSESRPPGFGGAAKRTETTSDHHVTEDAVMASEIEQLPDLAGFLKVASRPEWRRITIASRRIAGAAGGRG